MHSIDMHHQLVNDRHAAAHATARRRTMRAEARAGGVARAPRPRREVGPGGVMSRLVARATAWALPAAARPAPAPQTPA